jgi:hypothetical protein
MGVRRFEGGGLELALTTEHRQAPATGFSCPISPAGAAVAPHSINRAANMMLRSSTRASAPRASSRPAAPGAGPRPAARVVVARSTPQDSNGNGVQQAGKVGRATSKRPRHRAQGARGRGAPRIRGWGDVPAPRGASRGRRSAARRGGGAPGARRAHPALPRALTLIDAAPAARARRGRRTGAREQAAQRAGGGGEEVRPRGRGGARPLARLRARGAPCSERRRSRGPWREPLRRAPDVARPRPRPCTQQQ